jgi:hypothetical protein
MKSVSGLFDSYAEARHAADELMVYGAPASRISIIASDLRGEYTATRGDGESPSGTGAGALTGGLMGGAAGVAVGLTGLTIPILGPVIAAGPIVAALAGAGMGAVVGGLMGALASVGVDSDEARIYAEGIRRGGAVVTVECNDDEIEALAAILSRHGVVDIARRAEAWRRDGWRDFDPAAQPYTLADIEREQAFNRSRESAPR